MPFQRQFWGDHYGNFVKAVRNRKSEDLNADILEGHLSSALCHLGNISYRLGKQEPFGVGGKAASEKKETLETFERMQEHLRENKVPVEDGQVRIGRKLLLNSQTETFVNDKEADAMATRVYRAPFVVPEKV